VGKPRETPWKPFCAGEEKSPGWRLLSESEESGSGLWGMGKSVLGGKDEKFVSQKRKRDLKGRLNRRSLVPLAFKRRTQGETNRRQGRVLTPGEKKKKGREKNSIAPTGSATTRRPTSRAPGGKERRQGKGAIPGA